MSWSCGSSGNGAELRQTDPTLSVLLHGAGVFPSWTAAPVIDDLGLLRIHDAEHQKAIATGVHCDMLPACDLDLDVGIIVPGVMHTPAVSPTC
jgi:hypothetical protein